MSLTRAELQESARKAFGAGGIAADDASWRLLVDMGWLMMSVPEALGGLGLGREAAGVIHGELGRVLAPGPVIAQMLVIDALAAADGAPGALIERAMAGEVMTASLAGPGGDRLACVPDADRASHILAIGDRRVDLVPLEGAKIALRDTWDRTRRLFDVTLDPEADGLMLAQGDAAAALAHRLEAQLLFALAADSLGGAAAILELTIEHLKTRRQYGRPLAMFQALKHRVADMKAWLSAAEALLWARAAAEPALPVEMGAFKAHATGVYRAIAEDAVQLHGGIGLTMEHHCHLFLKRAMLNCALGGDTGFWEEAAGRRALAEAAE